MEGKWVELTLSVSNIEANVFGIDISLDSCIDSSTLNIDYMKIQCSSVNATSICKVFQILVRGDKQNVNNLTIGLCVYATVSGQINATNSQQYKIRVIGTLLYLYSMHEVMKITQEVNSTMGKHLNPIFIIIISYHTIVIMLFVFNHWHAWGLF